MLMFVKNQRLSSGPLWLRSLLWARCRLYLLLALFIPVSGVQSAVTSTSVATSSLTLEDALAIALEVDPVLQRQRHLSAGFDQESRLAGYWPRPSVSISAQNLPMDTLDASQEAMTQLRLAVTQPLPQGNSLHLTRQLAQQRRVLEDGGADDRRSQLIRQMRLVWLDVVRADQSETVVRQSLVMLETLNQVIQRRYRVATEQGQRVDLARLSVEQEKRHDRLLAWEQQKNAARRRLNEFLPNNAWQRELAIAAMERDREWGAGEQTTVTAQQFSQGLREHLMRHPRYVLASRRTDLSSTQTDLAREQDKPRWTVQGAYGYRADDAHGNDRANVVSIGVGVEVPWFHQGQSAHRVGAAMARHEAALSQRDQIYRSLESQAWQWFEQGEMLQHRKQRFRQKQLPLLERHIDAAETLYRQGVGDFESVIRAQVSRLESELSYLRVHQQWAQAQVELAYYLNPLSVTAVLMAGGGLHE